MKIKIDNNLELLARIAGKGTKETAEKLAELVEQAAEMPIDEFAYGMNIFELALEEGWMHSKTFYAMFDVLGIDSVSVRAYEALRKCIIIGDGDCPECGGNLEFADEDNNGEPFGSPDYNWKTRTYRCKLCGEEVVKQNNI